MIIKILKRDEAAHRAHLFRQLYQARARVFHQRLGWDVSVYMGLELDDLDTKADPVYVVMVDPDDNVLGSLRILSGKGPTLLYAASLISTLWPSQNAMNLNLWCKPEVCDAI
ncbi:acyl-homoserine-lactone synthase, partial [Agrobacterium sp. NPDC089420]|uniref:acyl-homoserine-lactone synthase n=1 Tax=Agrobacterium sp. NPDC089420 TaxID=3363918 RepID=UPI00384D5FC1